MAQRRVVIIGAGFGGLQCAEELENEAVDVLLVDRNNYHLFTPLLYQVASALLNPGDIAHPVRGLFRGGRNVRFLLGEVVGVDFSEKRVTMGDGTTIPYDVVVIASGSTTNFFGMESVAERARGLKDIPEALELRNHILSCFEGAARTDDEETRRKSLTFVIVGGGPTGVEFAGALSELVRRVLARDFRDLDVSKVRIILIEALQQILPMFPADLGKDAQRELEHRGIEVRLASRVAGYENDAVQLDGGGAIETRTLVWAAGVRPSPLAAAIDVPRVRNGRIDVDSFLRVKGRPDAYAIGDVASVTDEGKEIPMLAAPAMQEGRHVAANILRAVRGEEPVPFRYRDKGTMATIGRNAAVVQSGRLRLTGFVGWIAWLFLHLYYLIGFRNRVMVFLGWAWNYIRFDRPVRLITTARSRPD